jgi:flagellar biosynthesis protein FliR
MLGRKTKMIVGLIATTLISVFIIGLAHSISTGFAGFWGGLPFWIISLSVLSMAVYNFWEECIKKKD